MISANANATLAQQLADLLGNDGLRFRADDGRDFDEIVAALGGSTVEWRDGYWAGHVFRHVLRDGSVITVAGDAWDLGFAECYCWQGEGHTCGAAA